MSYYTTKNVNNPLKTAFETINSESTFWDFLEADFSDYVFARANHEHDDVDEAEDVVDSFLVGAVTMVQFRVPDVECPRLSILDTAVIQDSIDSFKCLPSFAKEGDFYEEDLNHAWSDCSTWEYDDMVMCNEGEPFDWTIFDSDFENSIPFTLQGYQGAYDMTSGYFQLFSNKETTIDSFTAYINLMRENQYFTQNTRAIVLVFNLYNPVTTYFTSVNILIEQSGSGFTTGSRFMTGPFMKTLLARSDGSGALEVFRIIINSILVIKVLLIFMKKSSIETCLTMHTLGEIFLTSVTLFMQFYSISLSFNQQSFMEQDSKLIHEPEINDLYQQWGQLALNYKEMLFWESLSLIIIAMELLTMCKVFRPIEFFLANISLGGPLILSFMGIFIMFLLGMAINSITIWGNQYQELTNFLNSLLRTLVSPIFYQSDNENGYTRLLSSEQLFVLIQVHLYYAICIYLLLASFVAIFSDVYRNNSIIKGNPLKTQVRSSRETIWNLITWLLGWLPQTWIKRLAQLQKDDDDEPLAQNIDFDDKNDDSAGH